MESYEFPFSNIGTDLALEARDLVRGATGREIPGVVEEKQNFAHGTVTIIKILDPQAERLMGKPRGTYVTIEAPDLKLKSPDIQAAVADVLAQHLKNLLKIPDQGTVLIIGLGNWQATPDALGPTVVKYTLVTRHLHLYMPQMVANYRPVCALAPGVLGITGIESAEIIKGVVEKVQPSAIIAIDALAATSTARLGTTIQIGDTGIAPGSGVNNKRTGINMQTMGVPVIAIGVPTVVNAAVIIKAAMRNIPPHISEQMEEMIVTPREIDDLILNAGRTINRGITYALHPRVAREELDPMLC